MKSTKIIPRIAEKIRVAKLERREAQVKTYLSFERVKSPEIKQELHDAREVLANYAKANNVTINVSDWLPENQIRIGITNFNTMNSAMRVISTTKEPLIRKKTFNIMTTDHDGLNHVRKGCRSFEDTFLRRVYKVVEELTSTVNNQK